MALSALRSQRKEAYIAQVKFGSQSLYILCPTNISRAAAPELTSPSSEEDLPLRPSYISFVLWVPSNAGAGMGGAATDRNVRTWTSASPTTAAATRAPCAPTPTAPSCASATPATRATDMDECATFDNVCVFGVCVNTYGMFKCICDKGYQSDNVDELMPGFNCTDVDECKSPQSCQYGECLNTQGSYICRCPPNYELVSDGTACFDSRKARCYGNVDLRSGTERCHDRDELSEDGTMAACCCSVGAAWGNYCDLCPEPGSEEYRQLCPGGPGYQPVLEPPSYVVTLADIDECEQHPALCEHGTCTNTFGSFVCTCGDGWLLADDEQRCIDVDECAEPDICGVGICRNMPGSYVCLCPEGYVPMPSNSNAHLSATILSMCNSYRLMADIEECEDVDECADRRLCDHGDCRNTVGSFSVYVYQHTGSLAEQEAVRRRRRVPPTDALRHGDLQDTVAPSGNAHLSVTIVSIVYSYRLMAGHKEEC
ncbi:hypothetical protein evm_013135 [Chilo suppressalis]|nr:hypothetical protein evm_013135 [Chilo suppressalis]